MLRYIYIRIHLLFKIDCIKIRKKITIYKIKPFRDILMRDNKVITESYYH